MGFHRSPDLGGKSVLSYSQLRDLVFHIQFFFKFLLLSSELSLITAKFFFEEVDFVFHFEKPNERVLNLHFVELNRKKHTYCVAYERAELI